MPSTKATTIDALIDELRKNTAVHKISYVLSKTYVITACRVGKADKRKRVCHYVITEGKPNYDIRQRMKLKSFDMPFSVRYKYAQKGTYKP